MRHQFQLSFYLVVAAGQDAAGAELLLERVVLLRCGVTTVLRSRASLMLFEALSCPIPAVTSRAVWAHHDPGGPETRQGSKRTPRPTRILCLVKNLQTVQGELLFPESSDPYLHPSSSSCFLRDSQSQCSNWQGRAGWDWDSPAAPPAL